MDGSTPKMERTTRPSKPREDELGVSAAFFIAATGVGRVSAVLEITAAEALTKDDTASEPAMVAMFWGLEDPPHCSRAIEWGPQKRQYIGAGTGQPWCCDLRARSRF